MKNSFKGFLPLAFLASTALFSPETTSAQNQTTQELHNVMEDQKYNLKDMSDIVLTDFYEYIYWANMHLMMVYAPDDGIIRLLDENAEYFLTKKGNDVIIEINDKYAIRTMHGLHTNQPKRKKTLKAKDGSQLKLTEESMSI